MNSHVDFLLSSMSPSLVELPPHVNPYHNDVVVYALLPPVHSLKIIPTYYILKDAHEKGLLEGIHTIVENTSGNFGANLAIWAPHFGIKNVMLCNTADGKFTTLDDVADLAVFFGGFDSNALTGQSLLVSHGWDMD